MERKQHRSETALPKPRRFPCAPPRADHQPGEQLFGGDGAVIALAQAVFAIHRFQRQRVRVLEVNRQRFTSIATAARRGFGGPPVSMIQTALRLRRRSPVWRCNMVNHEPKSEMLGLPRLIAYSSAFPSSPRREEGILIKRKDQTIRGPIPSIAD